MELEIDFLSLNVRGMRVYKKNQKMLNWLVKHNAKKSVCFLQETHSTIDIEERWKERFRGKIIMSHGTPLSRGVAILIGEKIDVDIIVQLIDDDGRLVILLCKIQGQFCLLINSYFPNEEKEQINFCKSIMEKINQIDMPEDTAIIWGGDFNFVIDIQLESSGGNPKLKIGSIEQLRAILKEYDLCDIWRIRNPNSKRYTWKGYAQGLASKSKQALYRRLDFFYISDALQPLVKKVILSQYQALIIQQ